MKAKDNWLNGQSKLSMLIDELINEHKLITSANISLIIENYYEKKIYAVEKLISDKLISIFPQAQREMKFNLGNNKSWRADLFLKKENINFIFEFKQSDFFNENWIYRLREVQSILDIQINSLFTIIVSNILPEGFERYGQIDGVIICKPEEIINVISFCESFNSKFIEFENENTTTTRIKFSSTTINFLENKNLIKKEISTILFPFFLLSILDNIIIDRPIKIEERNMASSNINPNFYKFINYEIGLWDNTSGINLKNILKKIFSKNILASFSDITNSALYLTTDQKNQLILDLFDDMFRGLNSSMSKFIIGSGIFKALKILIEKNIIIEFLELQKTIKFDFRQDLKEELHEEYHKIHSFNNFEYTNNNLSDLLSRLL